PRPPAAPTRHPGEGPPPRGAASPDPSRDSWGLRGVRLLAVLIEITAVAVVDHDGGKAFHLEASDGLGAEVLVGDDLGLLHVARQHGAGATDGSHVDAFVLLERVLHRLAPMALAERALEAELEPRRR